MRFTRTLLLGTLACGLTLAIPAPQGAQAQSNPVMTNAIPDSGSYAAEGRVSAYNPAARTIVVTPLQGGWTLPMTIPQNVRLPGNIEIGDHVSVHYTRNVDIKVSTPKAPIPRPSTETLGQLARSPGGLGIGAQTINGTVTKIDGPNSFDVVDHSGGGVYTVRSTDPARVAMITKLKPGDTVSVAISALQLNSLAECGLFGLGC